MKKSLLPYSIIFLTLLILLGFANTYLYMELDLLLKEFPEVGFWSIGKNLVCIPIYITLFLMLVTLVQMNRIKNFHFERFVPMIKRHRMQKTFRIRVLGMLLCLAISIRLLYMIMYTVNAPLNEPGNPGNFLQTFFLGF
ncbi:hypothetical protein [Fluviicola sp.]|uniref:hypothetical protein n=1 Tax=Fluviicola sp. TaxID=1917219 RepID=UPI0031CF5A44